MRFKLPHVDGPKPLSTHQLIHQLCEGDPDDELSLATLLDQFQERAFGVFLLLALLPTFFPIPAGQGAISGFLTTLIGLQFLLRYEHPWVPGFIAKRSFHRSRIISFKNRFDKWLYRLDKITTARGEWIFIHPVAHAFTGLLLLLLGIILSLPLPGTNIPFGIVLLLFCIAMIERDGRFMLIGWIFGIVEIITLGFFSQQVVALITSWF